MLQFIDCPSCKKRIRQVATRCHHCGFQLTETDDAMSPELAEGGYDESQDDFDYDEYLEEEFQNKPPLSKMWVFVAWIVLFALVFPVAIQIIAVFR